MITNGIKRRMEGGIDNERNKETDRRKEGRE